MNLLKEGIEQKLVVRTTMTRKLTVDGITMAYPVYKVRLDCLFYNDQNDRIATWMSQYKSQNEGRMPDLSNREEYNEIIEKFIVESNPDAIRKTQTNIELVDQREPGVVLADGRVIDGNRRFTCLRRLAEKNDRFMYFETVILDRNYENSAKQIKMLELAIQHGEESKVEYSTIDRLVGVYNDIIDTKLLSEEEYAKSTNESLAEVKKKVELAQLMIEFLEFINAPKQFYIARDLQIYSVLEELEKLLRKCKTEDEKEDLKISVFNNLLMQTTGDLLRFIRNFKSIIGTAYQEEFLEEQKEFAEKSLELLPEVGKVDTTVIRDVVRGNDELNQGMERSVEKALTKVKKNDTRNRPIQLAEKATTFLEDIDTNIISKMNDSEIQRLKRQLDRLVETVETIKEQL
ncbi:MAG: hypothetical protein IKL16_06230 [Clostridia bacterium]|nr:hypothetical protein [Clostridia bacterium]